ncbi:MAG: hypothetical protein ER33_07230 [Cyanobium sp. CACIAM 14]|nr:MAG: hypothetical protein ER33_07230 [Cyanobium sp. CACIAM 14]
MGQLTDSLRATLRDLAQSDARLYRGLQEELGDPSAPQSTPVLAGEARASREELKGQTRDVLLSFCRQRALPRVSGKTKDQLIELLLSHPEGPPLRSALPARAARGTKAVAGGGKARAQADAAELRALELHALELRLDRLEQLVRLIARQVGVPPEAIAQLATTPELPPT